METVAGEDARIRLRMVDQFLKDSAGLRNWYWRIRAERNANRRRTWYRRAAKEKARLAGLGWDWEVIRLYGLYLRDTTREQRFRRFLQEFEEVLNGPRQLALF